MSDEITLETTVALMQKDIENALQIPVKLANDANCFALSEATDGAGAGAGAGARACGRWRIPSGARSPRGRRCGVPPGMPCEFIQFAMTPKQFVTEVTGNTHRGRVRRARRG